MSTRALQRNQQVRQRARQLGLFVVVSVLLLAGFFIFFLFANQHSGLVRGTGVGISLVLLGISSFFLFRIVNLFQGYRGVVEKATSEKLSKTEGKFKALIQNSLDLITILDFKGNIQYQSPSAEKVLGYPADELVGQPIFELVHAEDHPLMRNVLDQKSQSFFFSFRLQHRDGTWMWFEATGTNLSENPLIGGLVVNSRDISDRKREEAARRQKELTAMRMSVAKERAEEEKRIIEEGKKKLEEAYSIIEHKNQEIMDSITYAFRIQTALLPQMEDIKAALPSSFVFWRPKDVVSGDFYWFAIEKGKILIAAADCTGHGVPGAFMTMIGNTLLNQIVKQDGVVMPDQILNNLHKGVRKALKQDVTASRDGMDISFLMIDPFERKAHWAGANNPLIFVRNGEVDEIKADKVPIGGIQDEAERIFTPHSLDLQAGDRFFVYTDGYQDQFGGTKGRKYMVKKFKQKLLDIANLSPEEQRTELEKDIVAWMGKDYEQIDDILVIGISL